MFSHLFPISYSLSQKSESSVKIGAILKNSTFFNPLAFFRIEIDKKPAKIPKNWFTHLRVNNRNTAFSYCGTVLHLLIHLSPLTLNKPKSVQELDQNP